MVAINIPAHSALSYYWLKSINISPCRFYAKINYYDSAKELKLLADISVMFNNDTACLFAESK